MSTINIRQATASDLNRIVCHYGRGDSPWDPFGDLTKLKSIPLEGLIIAEARGKYAGFLYWFAAERPWLDPRVEKYAHIVEVQIVERYRGQGVGKKLLSHALQRLKKKPIEAIYIETTEENTAARSLYESVGFRPILHTIHYKLEAGRG